MSTTPERIHAFHGRVVLRNLPPEWPADALLNRPEGSAIDPSTLKTGSGPLHYRPTRVESVLNHFNGNVNSEDFSTKQKQRESEPSSSSISVYLYPETLQMLHIDDTATECNAEMHMKRDAKEPAQNTLKRMVLNLSKKLHNGDNRNYKAVSKKNIPAGQIWKLNDRNEPTDKVNLSEFSCAEMCAGKLATENLALSIERDIMAMSPSNHMENNPIDAQHQSLWLLVENHPPTILKVHAFDEFQTRIFRNVPVHIEVDLLHANACRMEWFVGTECRQSALATIVATDESHVFRGISCYTPTTADMDQPLAVHVTPLRLKEEDSSTTAHSGDGCQEAFRFQHHVEALPRNTLLDIRQSFLERREHQFRIVTYNILADQNAFQMNKEADPMFPYVAREILQRSRRLPLIVHELLAYQADILCLQEVDEMVFHGLLRPILQFHRYQGFFTCKVGSGEGCALFWSLDQFHAVPDHECQSIVLQHLAASKRPSEWNAPLEPLFRARKDLKYAIGKMLGHVAQLVPLKPKVNAADKNHATLWAANIHLYYHPEAAHVRLMQMYLFCGELYKAVHSHGNDGRDDSNGKNPLGIVVCGDFNASLEAAAGKLLVDRFVPGSYRDLQAHLESYRNKAASSRKKDDNFQFPDIALPDDFPALQSALPERPAFTHFVDGYVGTLDHVLVHGLQLSRHAPMPSVEDVTQDTAMPSASLPSDHVSLVCDLGWNREVE